MAQGAEPQVLREYRHLLRTASADWQETAHRHALWRLGPRARGRLLTELQRLLLAGTRLGPDDVHAVARLVVLAERRRPRLLLDGLPADLRDDLATAVVTSPTGRMLAAGLDVWDGTDPPTRPEPPPEPDHHQRWHEQRATPGEAGELSVLAQPQPHPPPRPPHR
ncbi:hypothetical protein GCM10023168_07650 [Fodinibacter luteus]|uniref:Uncharacterized protein n=1 Tax=Fodinibacter luteus TaxID=552064 RepID=A0ABP8K3B6_9MICO